jgi:putative membrane protein
MLTEIPLIPSHIETALSFAMALLLAFRINRAYERWWEARTLWGTLVNVSRNLAVKVRNLLELDPAEQRQMRDLIVDFSFHLKQHLQHGSGGPGSASGGEPRPAEHTPSRTVSRIYAAFDRWHHAGLLSYELMWVLDQEARVLLDVCGGCERIRNTLMSVSWRSLTQQCIVLYLLVLPWGLVNDFGLWTVPITVIVAYLAVSCEVLAYYVERPFGDTEDHLDLDSLCETIATTVTGIFGADGDPQSPGTAANRNP